MIIEEKVAITITIPKEYRDRLRTMAAEQNLQYPDRLTSASTIAREILTAYLDRIVNEAAAPAESSQADGKEEKGGRLA